jgi:hypothetical protein
MYSTVPTRRSNIRLRQEGHYPTWVSPSFQAASSPWCRLLGNTTPLCTRSEAGSKPPCSSASRRPERGACPFSSSQLSRAVGGHKHMKSVAGSHVHSTTKVATSTVSPFTRLVPPLGRHSSISVGSCRAVSTGQPLMARLRRRTSTDHSHNLKWSLGNY